MEYIIITVLSIAVATIIIYILSNRVLGFGLRLRPLVWCAVCALLISVVLPRLIVSFAGPTATIGFLAIVAISFAYFVAYYETANDYRPVAEPPTALPATEPEFGADPVVLTAAMATFPAADCGEKVAVPDQERDKLGADDSPPVGWPEHQDTLVEVAVGPDNLTAVWIAEKNPTVTFLEMADLEQVPAVDVAAKSPNAAPQELPVADKEEPEYLVSSETMDLEPYWQFLADVGLTVAEPEPGPEENTVNDPLPELADNQELVGDFASLSDEVETEGVLAEPDLVEPADGTADQSQPTAWSEFPATGSEDETLDSTELFSATATGVVIVSDRNGVAAETTMIPDTEEDIVVRNDVNDNIADELEEGPVSPLEFGPDSAADLVLTIPQEVPRPASDSLDDLLEFAFAQRDAGSLLYALSAFRQALRLYRDSEVAPLLAIEIAGLLKDKGAYDEAIAHLTECRSLPGVEANSLLDQEIISTIAFLRIVNNTLMNNRLGSIPFHEIPSDVAKEIDSEFREWHNLA